MSVGTIRQDLVAWLLSYIERELGLSLDDLDVELASLGADSLEAVTLVGELEQYLARPLPPTLFLDCSTLAELVDRSLAEPGAASAEHNDRDEQCGEFAHPFGNKVNPFLARKLEQLKIDKRFLRGEGCYLYDQDGRRYLDFMAQYGALPFGHNPAEIWQAIHSVHERQEPTFVQPSVLDAAGALAERLVAIAPPGLDYVTFVNSGTEAVEAAIKLCRHATGRSAILSTERGFHGKTLAALSASGRAEYQTPFNLPLEGFDHVPFGNLEALRKRLATHPERYAAFLVEPIQGEGGVNEVEADYFHEAKALCQAAGVLMVMDEVQTGLGRTGSMFASSAMGVAPDVLTLAKALGGGLVAIGACLCSAAVYREKFALKHSSTFAGNTLAARVGLASLDLLERDDGALIRQVASNGTALKARLQQVQHRFPQLIRAIKGRGYMLGIHFGVRREQWPENFLGIAAEQGQLGLLVASYLLNVEGLRVAPTLNQGEVLRIQPPLTASLDQCMAAADAIERGMEVLASGDTGRFYGSILDRRARSKGASVVHHSRPSVPYRDPEPRFAFLMHPLDADSYLDFDASLASLASDELEEFVASMDGVSDPVVSSSVRISSPTGATARGDFILMGHTTKSLLSLNPGEISEALGEALDLARERGAQIVGLGAYTSVLSQGGLSLAERGLPLTSGNSFTSVAGVEALELALRREGLEWQGLTGAVVGAAGAIGCATATLLSEQVSRLVLIGNPARGESLGRQKLLQTAARICRHLSARIAAGQRFAPGSLGGRLEALGRLPDPMAPVEAFHAVAEALEERAALVLANSCRALGRADVVVTATSFPGAVFAANDLKAGALVCDLSRPRSVPKSILEERPDVKVIDGGLIELPGRPYLGPYGLDTGLAYACMAETMLLALDGHYRHTSLGPHLKLDEIVKLRALARRHGFAVAELQSFGRALATADWALPHERPSAPLPGSGNDPSPHFDSLSNALLAGGNI
jgi:acetylornithine/succinyldiaminopimelate/putrescine aminotransferase/predicted amino acid dehydrogenase/acyl carrier protein